MTERSSGNHVAENYCQEKFSGDFYEMLIKQENSSYNEFEIKEEPLDLSNEDYSCKTDSEFELSNDSESESEVDHHNQDSFNIFRRDLEENDAQNDYQIESPQQVESTQIDLKSLLKEQTLFMKNMTKLLHWRKLREKKEKENEREKEKEEEKSKGPRSLLQKLLEENQREITCQKDQLQVLKEAHLSLEGKRKYCEDGVVEKCKRQRVKNEALEGNSYDEMNVKQEDTTAEDEDEDENEVDEDTPESSSSSVEYSDYMTEIQKIMTYFLCYPPNVLNSVWTMILNNNGLQNTNSDSNLNSDYEMVRESRYSLNTSNYEWNVRSSQDLLNNIQEALNSGMFRKRNFEQPEHLMDLSYQDINEPVPSTDMSNHGSSPGTSGDSHSLHNNGLTSDAILDLRMNNLSTKKSNAVNQENFGFDDHTLKTLSVREFNKRVSLFPHEVQAMLRKRRRTLKNRGYASSCRVKRQVYKQKLEEANSTLRSQIEAFKSKLIEANPNQQTSHTTSSTSYLEGLPKKKEGDEEEFMEDRDEDQIKIDQEHQSLDLQYKKQLEAFFPTRENTASNNIQSSGDLYNYITYALSVQQAGNAPPNVVLQPYSNTLNNYVRSNSVNSSTSNNNVYDSSTSNTNKKRSKDTLTTEKGSMESSLSGEEAFITDKELLTLSVVELNKRLNKLPKDLQQIFKLRRRTLKNRNYAKNCRTRRMINKERLEIINTSLKMELAMYKTKLKQVGRGNNDLGREENSNRGECLNGRDESLSQRDELLSQRDESLSQRDESFSRRGESFSRNDESRSDDDESLSERDEHLSQREGLLSKRDESVGKIMELFSERNESHRLRKESIRTKDHVLSEGKKSFPKRKMTFSIKNKDLESTIKVTTENRSKLFSTTHKSLFKDIESLSKENDSSSHDENLFIEDKSMNDIESLSEDELDEWEMSLNNNVSSSHIIRTLLRKEEKKKPMEGKN